MGIRNNDILISIPKTSLGFIECQRRFLGIPEPPLEKIVYDSKWDKITSPEILASEERNRLEEELKKKLDLENKARKEPFHIKNKRRKDLWNQAKDIRFDRISRKITLEALSKKYGGSVTIMRDIIAINK